MVAVRFAVYDNLHAEMHAMASLAGLKVSGAYPVLVEHTLSVLSREQVVKILRASKERVSWYSGHVALLDPEPAKEA